MSTWVQCFLCRTYHFEGRKFKVHVGGIILCKDTKACRALTAKKAVDYAALDDFWKT